MTAWQVKWSMQTLCVILHSKGKKKSNKKCCQLHKISHKCISTPGKRIRKLHPGVDLSLDARTTHSDTGKCLMFGSLFSRETNSEILVHLSICLGKIEENIKKKWTH